MSTIGWIDALRQYNAGMPSWCVPRKGTPGYESVMRIRRGEEQAKSFKEVLEDLERKTSGKPKKEKKTMTIDLSQSKEEVNVPTESKEDVKIYVPDKTSVGFRLFVRNKNPKQISRTYHLTRLRVRGDKIEGRSKADKKWRDFTGKLDDGNTIRLTGDYPMVNQSHMREVKKLLKTDLNLQSEEVVLY